MDVVPRIGALEDEGSFIKKVGPLFMARIISPPDVANETEFQRN